MTVSEVTEINEHMRLTSIASLEISFLLPGVSAPDLPSAPEASAHQPCPYSMSIFPRKEEKHTRSLFGTSLLLRRTGISSSLSDHRVLDLFCGGVGHYCRCTCFRNASDRDRIVRKSSRSDICKGWVGEVTSGRK